MQNICLNRLILFILRDEIKRKMNKLKYFIFYENFLDQQLDMILSKTIFQE